MVSWLTLSSSPSPCSSSSWLLPLPAPGSCSQESRLLTTSMKHCWWSIWSNREDQTLNQIWRQFTTVWRLCPSWQISFNTCRGEKFKLLMFYVIINYINVMSHMYPLVSQEYINVTNIRRKLKPFLYNKDDISEWLFQRYLLTFWNIALIKCSKIGWINKVFKSFLFKNTLGTWSSIIINYQVLVDYFSVTISVSGLDVDDDVGVSPVIYLTSYSKHLVRLSSSCNQGKSISDVCCIVWIISEHLSSSIRMWGVRTHGSYHDIF